MRKFPPFRHSVHPELLDLVAASALGYFLGSIPTAYLLVRWKSHLDIRETGSGNVGALNSFEVTKSRGVGVAVLAGDLLKGVLAVALGRTLQAGGFSAGAVAGVAAVVGHNFPIWLRFRGGRGLAPAAGTMLATAPVVVPVWLALWAAGFGVTRSVNPANAIATVLLIVGYLAVPTDVVAAVIPADVPAAGIRVMGIAVLLPVLVRLFDPAKRYVRDLLKGSQGDLERGPHHGE